MNPVRNTSSFRDPSGYVFSDGTAIKRVVFPSYFKQYNALSDSGFYTKLFDNQFLVRHLELSQSTDQIVLEAEKIPFITYPYEWSFLQYKHAALLTLKIQKYCLEHDFTLKDASAFNITFHEGKAVFIDTLSFDFYQQNEPWKAYKQFIMHFLAPLVLSHYHGLDFLKTLAADIDGISLKKLSKLLPAKSWLSPTLFTNIHLLAKYEGKYSESKSEAKTNTLTKSAQIKLLESLYDYIRELKAFENTEWDDYYNQTNYNDAAYLFKKAFTKNWFDGINGSSLIDIGGNDGTFTREISGKATLAIVADIDPNAVEQNYKKVLKQGEKNIYPLVADVLNPAANYGFNNEERFSFIDRVEALQLSGCLALAVIHHITLSGNIPFAFSAKFFSKMSDNLLIEFPTREDSWVQFLLQSKRDFKDHFDFYNEENFEKEYASYFEIISKETIPGAHRILYRMKIRK
ncbi:50S ribosomal protein L11 methyltransferase [Flavobacterium noncentrifugens]|uniref:Nodulation protein NoeA n=1 Tax=Flavobacterium noncentrifugens TaxID=1128970 RepID=A0A1G8VZW8_9FLAO|nr:nodulation protein NoeA [Flavobacterium noncentrifugens]GEP50711.1 50S ribosomal protein L11 methyltransferase [Flavobacterium noncentrifugens]SDJ71529.1 hypothetical protein SAMN04487935_1586 [Flavobacterium noncentrifugens]